MRLIYKSIFLLSLIPIVNYANEGRKECFQSIRYMDLKGQQNDSIKQDTLLQNEETKTDSVYDRDNRIRTVINFSLLIIIFFILIIAIAIFLILRKRRRVRGD